MATAQHNINWLRSCSITFQRFVINWSSWIESTYSSDWSDSVVMGNYGGPDGGIRWAAGPHARPSSGTNVQNDAMP